MKVLQFENSTERYRALAGKKFEAKDYSGALSLLFTALKNHKSIEVLADIADVYADMGLYEMSNQYWFLYLARAPKNKKGVAYKELGINFFYMDNYLVSGYYFNLKIKTDGIMGQDSLPEEILDFFSPESKDSLIKSSYRVVYPVDRTDYSATIREAKRLIAHGYFDKVEELLKNIPEYSPYYKEALDNSAVAVFINGETEKAKALNKELIDRYGDSVLASCNLSSIYNELDDSDKSRYYYQKAKTIKPQDLDEVYKLAICALEQDEPLVGARYLKKVLSERDCDINTRYLYALALMNGGKFSLASEELTEVLRLDPTDKTAKYYKQLAEKLIENGAIADKYLPLKYEGDVPEFEKKERKKLIKELMVCSPKQAKERLKSLDVFEAVEWGMEKAEEKIAQMCVYIFANIEKDGYKQVLLDKLMDTEFSAVLKRMIVYLLVLGGYDKKIGVVNDYFYMEIKPKKFAFLGDSQYKGLFLSSYAMAVSKMLFTVPEGFEKISYSANKLFLKLQSLPEDVLETLKEEEIAALMVKDARVIDSDKTGLIKELFKITLERWQEVLNIVYGEKNDKNN